MSSFTRSDFTQIASWVFFFGMLAITLCLSFFFLGPVITMIFGFVGFVFVFFIALIVQLCKRQHPFFREPNL